MTNKIDETAIVARLNDFLKHIGNALKHNDVRNFEYWSGVYDGYRDALAALGTRVVYGKDNTIIGIERI